MTQGLGRPPRVRRRHGPAAVTLIVPADVRMWVSPECFRELCAINTDVRLERNARGFLDIMPPASGSTGHRNAGLTGQLFVWSQADGTGLSFDSSTGFTLHKGAVRSPDAAWVTRPRWDALTQDQKDQGFPPVCPDFVAELRSKSDRLPRLRRKLRAYIAQGARLGWLIDPETGEVEVYRPGRPAEVLKRPTTLSGEDVLPGFVLDLKGILFDE